ncbi:efflux RND transporter periplasmic adaptor subunit [Planctomicrobium sp. SH527]|uniref:efflux RND transporter periplasmic adaptor subunit n=1 Tax=Planctomicrobium sp. SH527 TaxID=3448123 RepID=UPI003F5B2FCA
MAGLIFGATSIFGGCGQPNSYQAPPPPQVDVTNPIQRAVTSYVEQTGTAQASERVELRARISGFLHERNFEDGDIVKAGQVLFVIDEEPFKVRLQYATARQSEAAANLKKAEQSKAREIAQAQLSLRESEYQLARINHERNIGLLNQNALSRQEYDRTEAAMKTTEAQVIASKAEQEQADFNYETNILSAQAALELAKSDVNTAKIDLGYCRITAPINGRIDRRAVDIGNYISSDQTLVLATIVQVDPIYAYVAISENDLVKIQKQHQKDASKSGIPIMMGIGDERTFPHHGTIDYISPSVQSGTGTVQIRGIFSNAGDVMPGMFIRVRIPSEEQPNAILVPERALGYDQAGTFVYVVNKDDEIERRIVVAKDTIDSMKVVEGDLNPEDRVIADGLLKVRPKMKVSPVTPGPPTEATPAVDTSGADAPAKKPADESASSN